MGYKRKRYDEDRNDKKKKKKKREENNFQFPPSGGYSGALPPGFFPVVNTPFANTMFQPPAPPYPVTAVSGFQTAAGAVSGFHQTPAGAVSGFHQTPAGAGSGFHQTPAGAGFYSQVFLIIS